MAITYLGTAPLKISSEVVFDPKYGYTTRETYSGPQASLATLNGTLQLLGVRSAITQEGGRNYLTAHYALQDASGNTPETPNDYYELETEYVQESVWKNDLVEALAANLTVLSKWRREIESAMKGRLVDSNGVETSKVEGPLDPATTGFSGDQLSLYQLVLRDGDAYETTRQVLTRVRTISVAYSAQTVAQARPIIYTTAQLVAVFAIPAIIAARLPADPTEVPSGTLWSWKQRRNTSRYEWSGRVSEVMSWTFAAWSTVTHKLHA
jgi:hypothetical protein